MDPNALKQMLTTMVPFINTVGIVIDDIATTTATATLPDRKAVQNHLGTAHAGAVYTLGESATGGVVLALFADKLPGAFIALKTASASHRKALPGDVIATASLTGDATDIRAAFDQDGRVDFDVEVRFTVDGTETGHNVYTWAARAPR